MRTPTPFLNTVRRWLPRATAHSRRARHTRTPTPTPGDGTNTGLHPPHYPAHYRPLLPEPRKTNGSGSGAEKGADWLERAQLLTCVSLLAVARRFACCAPPAIDSLETKLTTDRVALATFAAGAYRESASASGRAAKQRQTPLCLRITAKLARSTHPHILAVSGQQQQNIAH